MLAQNTESSKWHVLLATWLGGFFVALDMMIFGIVLHPALSDLLGKATDTEIGQAGAIIMAVFMLGWSLGASLFGAIADYLGRAKTLMLTILIYALCTGLCALSHNWVEMAFYRFLVGFGIGGEISIGAVMLSESWSNAESKPYAMSGMWTSFGCGMLATSVLNFALGNFGWRWLFVAGIIPAFLTIYIRSTLKESNDFHAVKKQREDLKAKSASSLTVIEAKLLRFSFLEIFSVEHRSRVILISALASFAMVAYWAGLSWLPAWINQLTGTVAVDERSAASLVVSLGVLTATIAGGFLIKALGARNSLLVGFVGALISNVILFCTIKTFGTALLVWSFIAGFFDQVPFIILCIYIPLLFPAHVRGTAFGFCYDGAGRIIAALAILLGGQLIGVFQGSYSAAAACMAAVNVLGFAVAFWLPLPIKVSEQELEKMPVCK
jgi:MFS family permease